MLKYSLVLGIRSTKVCCREAAREVGVASFYETYISFYSKMAFLKVDGFNGLLVKTTFGLGVAYFAYKLATAKGPRLMPPRSQLQRLVHVCFFTALRFAEVKHGVNKSFYSAAEDDVILKYCLDHTTPEHPAQKELTEVTLTMPNFNFLGAPEVLAFNGVLIRAIKAKKILDVGVYTGASALSSALAMKGCGVDDGKVIACDITDQYEAICRKYWKMADVEDLVDFRVAPANKTLDSLINSGIARFIQKS